MPTALYLSPHLDDAVLSIGGLIHHQRRIGLQVTVLTVFAGDPPPGALSRFANTLHQRWGIPAASIELRRQEDRRACVRLGAAVFQLSLPEAIYRKDPEGGWLYPTEASIFRVVQGSDRDRIPEIAAQISSQVSNAERVYCPLGIGGHVDHLLTRQAAESLGVGLHYYPDLPYAARGGGDSNEFAIPIGETRIQALSAQDIQAWGEAVAEYQSQLSTFWQEVGEIQPELQGYHDRTGGMLIYNAASID